MKCRVEATGDIAGTRVFFIDDDDIETDISGLIAEVGFNHQAGEIPKITLTIGFGMVAVVGEPRFKIADKWGGQPIDSLLLEDGTVVHMRQAARMASHPHDERPLRYGPKLREGDGPQVTPAMLEAAHSVLCDKLENTDLPRPYIEDPALVDDMLHAALQAQTDEGA